MKVQIEPNLFIESDSAQYIVKQYKGDSDKHGRALAYYPSLAGCMKYIVNMMVKQTTAQTLQELVREIERIQEYIHTKLSI